MKFKLTGYDTDSIMFCKPDGGEFTKEEKDYYINDLNSIYPDSIRWEDDGYFFTVVVLKSKNYILHGLNKKTGKPEITYKGSSIRNPNREPAIKEFIIKVIDVLLDHTILNKEEAIHTLYTSRIKEIRDLEDITPWSFKKTITEKLYSSNRLNETKVIDAISEHEGYQLGDKIWLYYVNDDSLKLASDFNKDHNASRLYKRLYDTLKIFGNVVDLNSFKNYALKRNIKEVEFL